MYTGRMSKEKTIEDFIETDPKELPFAERAAAYEKELQPLIEKYGVAPWAGLASSQEAITAVPLIRDLLAVPEA